MAKIKGSKAKEAAEKGKPAKAEMKKEGLAQAVLKALGLGRLVKGAEKAEIFRKRFEEVNKEAEERLKKGEDSQ